MEEKEYFEKRLDEQIKWYSKKSKSSQSMFRLLTISQIICSALIPIFAVTTLEDQVKKIIIVILGAVITVISGLISLNHYQENWIKYRSTAEFLKQEKYLYLTQSSIYSNNESEHRFQLLVERVENSVSNENMNWSSYMLEQGGEKRNE